MVARVDNREKKCLYYSMRGRARDLQSTLRAFADTAIVLRYALTFVRDEDTEGTERREETQRSQDVFLKTRRRKIISIDNCRIIVMGIRFCESLLRASAH